MADGTDLAAKLSRLDTALDSVASRLTSDARPPASVLEEFTGLIGEAHRAVTEAEGGEPSAADRLALTRQAVQVRRKLQVVARLVAGSAWYAALARELEGETGTQTGLTYGRDGTAPAAPSGPSIERRA